MFTCLGSHRHLHSFPTRRSSDLRLHGTTGEPLPRELPCSEGASSCCRVPCLPSRDAFREPVRRSYVKDRDRKSTRLNSSHGSISYAVICLKKKTEGK